MKFLQILLLSISTTTLLSQPQENYSAYSYQAIIDDYNTFKAWGLHTTIDLQSCDPNLIRSKDAISEYIIQLCNLIEMKRFGDPTIVHFGEDEVVAGYSMVQLIETSCIAGHFANLTNNVYIDIFSCKLYDPHIATAFTKQFFQAKDVKINILLRI